MKTKIEKGQITIDIQELVESFDEKTKSDMCRYLVADERLFANVLECVVGGDYNNDDEDGSWWFSSEKVAELRAKLLPEMPEFVRGLVRQLIFERDSAKADAERYRNWAWKMFHAWQENNWRNRPELDGFTPTDFPTDKQVTEALKS